MCVYVNIYIYIFIYYCVYICRYVHILLHTNMCVCLCSYIFDIHLQIYSHFFKEPSEQKASANYKCLYIYT